MADEGNPPHEEDDNPVDPRVERAVQCVRSLVLERNAGFENELRALLGQIVADPQSPDLIADFADALADPATFGNMTSRVLDRFILQLDKEISNEASDAHRYGEARSGFWTFLTGGTLGLGVAVTVAPLWMAATGPFAPWVAGTLLATSGVSYWRRRVSSDLEDDANARKRGLESLKGALQRKRGT